MNTRAIPEDFDRHIRKGSERLRTGNYVPQTVFDDVSDCVTKTSKIKHAVKGSYRVLGQDRHTVVIQQKELFESITANRIALTPWPAGMTPISLDSTSTMVIQDKNLKGTP